MKSKGNEKLSKKELAAEVARLRGLLDAACDELAGLREHVQGIVQGRYLEGDPPLKSLPARRLEVVFSTTTERYRWLQESALFRLVSPAPDGALTSVCLMRNVKHYAPLENAKPLLDDKRIPAGMLESMAYNIGVLNMPAYLVESGCAKNITGMVIRNYPKAYTDGTFRRNLDMGIGLTAAGLTRPSDSADALSYAASVSIGRAVTGFSNTYAGIDLGGSHGKVEEDKADRT